VRSTQQAGVIDPVAFLDKPFETFDHLKVREIVG
jgi:hypothetical protein